MYAEVFFSPISIKDFEDVDSIFIQVIRPVHRITVQ